MSATSLIPPGRTRIAPTPSGFLHVGNAFNFLLTARLAKASESVLLLRIDDLDVERVRPGYVEDIFLTLAWLGVRWDEGPRDPADLTDHWSQRHRLERYRSMVMALKDTGALYPCGCSRSTLDRLTLQGEDHVCRTNNTGAATPGTPWRLRIPEHHVVSIPLLTGGYQLVDLPTVMPDPIIVQRDTGRPAYQLASLTDDLDRAITFIVRGEDLLPSTACQLYLAELLDLQPFSMVRFLHHPLIVGDDGSKLSKSAGAAALKAMRQAGIGPERIMEAVEDWAGSTGLGPMS